MDLLNPGPQSHTATEPLQFQIQIQAVVLAQWLSTCRIIKRSRVQKTAWCGADRNLFCTQCIRKTGTLKVQRSWVQKPFLASLKSFFISAQPHLVHSRKLQNLNSDRSHGAQASWVTYRWSLLAPGIRPMSSTTLRQLNLSPESQLGSFSKEFTDPSRRQRFSLRMDD